MIELYGIPNCATVKKARAWLQERKYDYVFHDFKQSPPTPEWLANCLQQIALDKFLNKRSTTWRDLSPQQQQQAATVEGAIILMCAYPSMIKRPVLVYQNQVFVGFTVQMYADIFQAA